jgi:hypothetical protein
LLSSKPFHSLFTGNLMPLTPGQTGSSASYGFPPIPQDSNEKIGVKIGVKTGVNIGVFQSNGASQATGSSTGSASFSSDLAALGLTESKSRKRSSGEFLQIAGPSLNLTEREKLLGIAKEGDLNSWAEKLELNEIKQLISKLEVDQGNVLVRNANANAKATRSNSGSGTWDLAPILHALCQALGNEQGPKPSGVGSPGFSLENVKNAHNLTPAEAIEHVATEILGGNGKNVRGMFRANQGEDVKAKAASFIRKVLYKKACEGEMHAVGIGNDVLASSWVGNVRYAAPYAEIALSMDNIANNISPHNNLSGAVRVANIIKAYTKGEDPELSEADNKQYGAKLREFATIQIAEMGRELRMVKYHKQENKELVGQALNSASKHGFSKVYVKDAKDYAVFALKGGQKELAKAYYPSDQGVDDRRSVLEKGVQDSSTEGQAGSGVVDRRVSGGDGAYVSDSDSQTVGWQEYEWFKERGGARR